MDRLCKVFQCDRRGDRYCCADCTQRCLNRCLNHPDRCNLVAPPRPQKPAKPPKEAKPRRVLTEEEKAKLIQTLHTSTERDETIAQRFTISRSTVVWYRHRYDIPRPKGVEPDG